jgi:hypothetical protein
MGPFVAFQIIAELERKTGELTGEQPSGFEI